MIRGTTPKLTFGIPFTPDMVAVGYITFNQSGHTVIEKDNSEWDHVGNVIELHLSQEDTLNLKEQESVEIQIRIRTNDDEALASDIIKVPAKRILKDGKI